MMSAPDRRGDVLLTGATGFLGMELLARYLERTTRTVLAPVRARDGDHARERIEHGLRLLFGDADGYRDRVIAIPADLERERLGLARKDHELLCERAEEIVHCAATVSFTTPIEQSRRINVQGTRNLLALAVRGAKQGSLRRFAHVSTAYVAGTHDGDFGEEDLEVGQRFRNPYERSKFEAERLVRERAAALPAVTILRPSIIVGESTTGWTPAFNVLYVPVRAFVKRQLRVLPANASAPVDVVPVDHVADAITHLTAGDGDGLRTYHLVAGEGASTVAELVELSARHLDRSPPPLVPPRLYRAAYPVLLACVGQRGRQALRRAAPFLPYYTMGVRYRRDHAARRLDPAGLRPPPLAAYYRRLLDYGLATNWSKRPRPRPQAIPELELKISGR
jgi:thioester reductase-like protein